MKIFILPILLLITACQTTPKEPCKPQTTEQTLMKSALVGLAIVNGSYMKVDCI